MDLELEKKVHAACLKAIRSGLVKSAESMALEVFRKLVVPSQSPQVVRVAVTVEEEVASYLNNKKRRELVQLEQENNCEVQVVSGEGLSPEYLKIECFDVNGREVKVAQG